jgi:hypothetical protein
MIVAMPAEQNSAATIPAIRITGFRCFLLLAVFIFTSLLISGTRSVNVGKGYRNCQAKRFERNMAHKAKGYGATGTPSVRYRTQGLEISLRCEQRQDTVATRASNIVAPA